MSNPSEGKPKRRVNLNPTEISFDLSSSDSPTATLTVSNTTDETLSFKVKTNSPSRYFVKPSQDLLLIGASVEIHIQLNPSEAAAVMNQAEPAPADRDKFLVSTLAVDEEFVTAVREAKRKQQHKEAQALFSDLWQKKRGTEEVAHRRVYCNFILPTSGTATKSSNAPSTTISNTTLPVVNSKEANGSQQLSLPEKSTSASSMTNSSQQPPLAAATTSSTVSKREESQKSVQAQKEDNSSSLEALKQKYQDTLSLLYSVTVERDNFQQKFKDVSRELNQLKEELRTSRRGNRFDTDEIEQKTMIRTSGYQPWHLIVVAMVSFLIARMLQFSKNEYL